jgi:virulence factor Mce-like protein
MTTTRILKNAVMIVIFAMVCIIGMEYLAINIGQPNPISHGYRVQGVFSDADGIPTAADVRVAGIVVGKVTDIAHDPAHPNATVVTMEISNSVADPVYSNGFAKVRPKTLLGEKYVDLTVGNSQGEAIPDMGMLPEARTATVIENDTIFNSFDAKTRDQQKQVLAALDAATQQRSGDIQAILPQLQQVVANLTPFATVYEKDNPQVDHIFVQLNTVMQTLADEHQQLAGFLSNGNVAFGAIAQRDAALIKTLQEFSNVATEFNTAAQPTIAAQRQSLAKLSPALDSEKAFLDLVNGPQAACGGKTCGAIDLINGTLLGNINYPSDQLTYSGPDGSTITNEWASMFSQPTDGYHGGSHAAQSIVLAVHCDEVSITLGQLGGLLLGSGTGSFQALLNQACAAVPKP